MAGVFYWLWKGGHNPSAMLDEFRREALEGAKHCHSEGCEVVGLLKEFKVCPQCKTARYCGAAARRIPCATRTSSAAAGPGR